jgi:uncharacterized protein YerC
MPRHPQTEEIIAYLHAGHTYCEAATRFDIPNGRIGRIARCSGISRTRGRRKGTITAKGLATKSAVLQAIDAGHTWNEIARDTGLSKQRVSQIAIENGRRRKRDGLFV